MGFVVGKKSGSFGGKRVGFRLIFKVACSDAGCCCVVSDHLYTGEWPRKLLKKGKSQIPLLFLFPDQSEEIQGKACEVFKLRISKHETDVEEFCGFISFYCHDSSFPRFFFSFLNSIKQCPP